MNKIRIKQIDTNELDSHVLSLLYGDSLTTGVVGTYVSVSITSGVDSQFIEYGNTYTGIPAVMGTLLKPSGQYSYNWEIRDVNTSGCYVDFSNTIHTTGYTFDLQSHVKGAFYGITPDFFVRDSDGNIVVV